MSCTVDIADLPYRIFFKFMKVIHLHSFLNKLRAGYLERVKSRFKSLSSEEYLFLLKCRGCHIGQHCKVFNTRTTIIEADPVFLHIGDYCKIAGGVTILCHDYSRSVLRRVYGEIIGEAGQAYVGNNVFIGMNAIILMGTHIGNNSIVGAGAIVKGHFPDNVVIAGNPAKVICTLEEFYQKRKIASIKECKIYIRQFIEKYNRHPQVSEMRAFFPLFLERSIEALKANDLNTRLSGDNANEVIADFLQSTPKYKNLSELIADALNDGID